MINPTFDLEEIRTCLSAIALSHHAVAFTLRDEATDKKLLQTQSFELPERTFAAVHGADWIEKLVPVHSERKPCEKIKHKISLSGKIFQSICPSSSMTLPNAVLKIIL